MKTAVIIPSRYGSSRFEGKPLAKILGRPMIQHVYERSVQAGCADMVAVATDDPRIFNAVEAFGGRAVMTSDTLRSGTDRAAEAAGILGLADTDLVINVQGDQPLIHPDSIAEVRAPFLTVQGLEMSTLACVITREAEITDPKDVKVVFDENGFALYFSRATIPFSRDGEAGFDVYKHLGVYAYTVGFLKTFIRLATGRLEAIEKLEQLRALENGRSIYVAVTRHDSPEVDLPSDIDRIASLLENPG